MTGPRLALDRAAIVAFRRSTNGLDARLPMGPASLRRAAWAGLQDSVPRAAVLSIHARVADTEPATWQDPGLVQLWGPRFAAYVVAAADRGVFTVGRVGAPVRAGRELEAFADRLEAFLGGRRMPYGQAGDGLGIAANSLRYAALTGRVLMRWDGARAPTIWTVPPPPDDPREAGRELARRHLHVFGPSTPAGFARWAGIGRRDAVSTFDLLRGELTPVATPIGDASILASDEAAFAERRDAADVVRLLPSGDAFYLLHGRDRELLVPEERRRDLLWTPRVWPGAILLGGEIVGTWRRAGTSVTLSPWRVLAPAETDLTVAEAASLPLPEGEPVETRLEDVPT